MLDDSARDAVARALAEDLGKAGDITSEATIPLETSGAARLVARADAVLAGTEAFDLVFRLLDPEVGLEWSAKDGERLSKGDRPCRLEGPLRSILAGERTALNFLQRLSGIATLTRAFVDRAPGVEIRDTRKTTPGLRSLEKAAVRAGGGTNHRMGLFDAILIKDNHVQAAGSVAAAVKSVFARHPAQRIEVECDTLDQVREAVAAGATELLLDNMDVATMTEAVGLAKGRARTEASGGITLDTVAAVAATGVDAISVGALTHSAPAVDLALDLEA